MTLYALRIDGHLRGIFTDEERCYAIVRQFEKAGQYSWEITPIQANNFYEEEPINI